MDQVCTRALFLEKEQLTGTEQQGRLRLAMAKHWVCRVSTAALQLWFYRLVLRMGSRQIQSCLFSAPSSQHRPQLMLQNSAWLTVAYPKATPYWRA